MARKMKPSGIDWLGDIPADWKLHRIKSVITDRTSGAWGNEPKGTDCDIICLRIADFEYEKFRFKNVSLDELTTRNYDSETIKKLMLKKGDILIEKSGGGEKTPVGRTVIFDKDYPALYANFMDRLRCSDLVTSDWLQYVFVVFYKNGYSKNYIKQTTGIQNLDLTSMLACERVPVPPLDEQRRIAAFLDSECSRIDSVVEKTRASIEEYKKLKQAIITRAVTKGIRPARPMKNSGVEWIGEIPAAWEVIKLKYIFSIIGGNGFPDILQGKREGDYPFCKVSDINSEADYVYTASNWVSQSVVDNNRFNVIPTGSIIMAKIGAALAKNHRKINAIKCCIDNNTQALVPKKNDDIRYLLYLSKCIDMSWFDNNSTVPSVNNTKLLNLFIPNPSIDEQEEISAYLDEKCAAIDRLISKKETLLTELESYKKSLIFEYVTGKKEAPE